MSTDDLIVAIVSVALLCYSIGFFFGERRGEEIGRMLGKSDSDIEKLRREISEMKEP